MSDEEAAAATPRRPHFLLRIVRSHDFVRDVIVTTLGVLIALGISMIVDTVGWRIRLKSTERMMDEELSIFRGATAATILSASCVNEKAAALHELLDAARATGKLPDIGGIGYTYDFGEFGDSWKLAQGSDVMLHMSPSDAMRHANRWVNIHSVGLRSADAQAAWQQLAVLEHRKGSIGIDTVDSAARDLIVATSTFDFAVSISAREDRRLTAAGISRRMIDGSEWDLAAMKKMIRGSSICQPLQVDGRPYRLKTPIEAVQLPDDLAG